MTKSAASAITNEPASGPIWRPNMTPRSYRTHHSHRMDSSGKWHRAEVGRFRTTRPLSGPKRTSAMRDMKSETDPNVWTGRVLQEAFGDGEVGLALMYPAFVWSLGSGP